MDVKELRKSISSTALGVRKRFQLRYVDILVDTKLPMVGVDNGNFFTQGESASAILVDLNSAVEMTGLHIKTCLLWYLDGAGALHS